MTEKQYDDWKLEAPESDENAFCGGVCGECGKFTSPCPCGCGYGFCEVDRARVHANERCEIEEWEAA